MNKITNNNMVYQYPYTFCLEYNGADNEQSYSFVCTNNDGFLHSRRYKEIIREYCGICGDANFEVKFVCCQKFSTNPYLSNWILQRLNTSIEENKAILTILMLDEQRGGLRISRRTTKVPMDTFISIHTAYIKYIVEKRLTDKQILEYRTLIAQAILDNLKAKEINKPMIVKIMSYFGVEIREKGGIMAQLRKIADDRTDEKILRQLTTDDKVRKLRYWLNRVEQDLNIKEETPYRVAAIIYAFAQQVKLLDTLDWEKVKTLFCDYFAINPPTFRRGDVLNYIDPNTKNPQNPQSGTELWKSIKNEHRTFWDNCNLD